MIQRLQAVGARAIGLQGLRVGTLFVRKEEQGSLTDRPGHLVRSILVPMVAIATRNLFHDKHKLMLALIGIIFSVVLVTLQLGLFLNALHNASGLIDNAGADVWIMQEGTPNIDVPECMSTRRYYQAITVPGVAWAEKLIVQICPWKLPSGQRASVEIVGIEPNSRLNVPWGMAVGKRDDMLHGDGVIIDERERRRFGGPERILQINDRIEISGRRTRMAAFSRGVGTFTMAPYVITTHKRAQDCAQLQEDETKFVLVKAQPNVTPEQLRDRLRARIQGVDIYTADEFAFKTRWYWMVDTGVGLGVIVGTSLSLIVGTVIVGQTMYSAAIERLKEYGTLKALGMSNLTLAGIITRQAIITGMIGYTIGSSLACGIGKYLPKFNVPVEVPLQVVVVMFFVTVAMCVVASISSIVRVFRLEPATVFRS